MNISNVVRVAGASVATLACAVVLSACGSDNTSAAVDSSTANPTKQSPIYIPPTGLGHDWMQPNSVISIAGLGLFAEPREGTHVSDEYTGVRMHGELCVLAVNYSSVGYEAALVLNEGDESRGRELGDLTAIEQFLAAQLPGCQPAF